MILSVSFVSAGWWSDFWDDFFEEDEGLEGELYSGPSEEIIMRVTNFKLDGGIQRCTFQYEKDGEWADVKSDARNESGFSLGDIDFLVGYIDRYGKTVELTIYPESDWRFARINKKYSTSEDLPLNTKTILFDADTDESFVVVSYVADGDLVAYYEFENNFEDSSGRENHAVNHGADFVEGVVGKALNFDDGDYAYVENLVLRNDFSIGLWTKIRSENEYGSVFVSQDEGGGTKNKWIFLRPGNRSGAPSENRGKTSFHINNPGVGADWVSGNAWTPGSNTWYHIVLTKNGNTYTFYRNGVFDGSDISSLDLPNVVHSLEIGKAESVFKFDGLMDEVKIWNRALTAMEVEREYESVGSNETSKCQTLMLMINNSWLSQCGDNNYDAVADIDKDGKVGPGDWSYYIPIQNDEESCLDILINEENPCLATCTDSDGGRDIYERGVTIGLEWAGENIIEQEDYCIEEGEKAGRLNEFYCYEINGVKRVKSETIGIEDGCAKCEDGACIVSFNESTCIETDNGVYCKLYEKEKEWGSVIGEFYGKTYEIFLQSILLESVHLSVEYKGGITLRKGESINLDTFRKVDNLEPLIGRILKINEIGYSAKDTEINYVTFTVNRYYKSCQPRYYCEIKPEICPSSGVQIKKCYEVECGGEDYEEEIKCNPGDCAGCEFDKKCIPYGFREKVTLYQNQPGEYKLYCDIDGELQVQKPDWASCQNSYECDSNLCSGGECTGINQMIKNVSKFV